MAYIPIRQERMSALIADADRFLTLELTSTPLHYRRALIMSVNLGSEAEP
jgi:hypothetical protein